MYIAYVICNQSGTCYCEKSCRSLLPRTPTQPAWLRQFFQGLRVQGLEFRLYEFRIWG